MSTTHTVVRGENLSRIARRYGMNWRQLYNSQPQSFRDSHPDPDLIYPGDVLIVPGDEEDDGPPEEDDESGWWHHVQDREDTKLLAYRLSRITDITRVLEHPKNHALFQERKHNVLNPGDRIFIPKQEVRADPGATEQRHRFKRRGSRKLILKLVDREDKPFREEPYTLIIEGHLLSGSTTTGGVIEQKIPFDAQEGKLTIRDLTFTVHIAGLDTVDTARGAQGRLNNLGYHIHAIDGVEEQDTRDAARGFQHKRSIVEDDALGDKTRSALERIHEV